MPITTIGEKASTSYWRECWQFRELLYYLVWRDLTVRHKQAFLGAAWIVLRPLLSMSIFTFVFSTLARFPSGAVPYPLFVLAAMVPWQFYAGILVDSPGALTQNIHLMSKVYFPRILLPLSQLMAASVDLGVSLVLLLGISFAFGELHWAHLWAFPFLCALLLLLAFGTALPLLYCKGNII